MIDNLVTAAGLACFLFGLFVFFSAVSGQIQLRQSDLGHRNRLQHHDRKT